MKVCIATDSPKLNEFFSIKFVGEGIQPYNVNNIDELINFIEEKEIEMLFIDFESKKYNQFDTIKEIKIRFNQLVIVLLTIKTGIDFAKKTVELGVFGFISKADDLETQFKEIMNLLENLKGLRVEQRKHMRVKPAPYQHNSFVLKLPGLDTAYKGIVKDISLGGIAASFDLDVPDILVFKGKEVSVDVELGILNFQARAVVVLKKSRDIAIYFKELRDNIKRKMCEYIISRVS